MKLKFLLIATVLCFFSTSVLAQLEPWTDYEVSDELWNITTVKVDPNMGDDYLEGLRETWVASNRIAKELGQIEDFFIYRSVLAESGHANLFLVVRFADSDQLDPNKEAYDKFMKAWGEANQEKSREITKNYPAMRTITGEYLVRRIDIK
ncbi:MAG: hypothetical protein P8Y52_05000 [Xanthomonadales bacterium]|jgi:lipopolysaccharide export LptBFGC system permease protein LptF